MRPQRLGLTFAGEPAGGFSKEHGLLLTQLNLYYAAVALLALIVCICWCRSGLPGGEQTVRMLLRWSSRLVVMKTRGDCDKAS